MIEDAYETIDSRHVRLPSPLTSESNTNLQLKCDLMHLVNVVSFFSSFIYSIIYSIDKLYKSCSTLCF
jgi:hypothetical protein